MCRRTFVLLIGLALPLGGAGDAALDRATLRGVTSVNVVIDPVAPDIEKEGATANVLRTRLEDRLREAGVQVDTKSTEFVGLHLTAVRATRGSSFAIAASRPFAIAATIGFYQPVTLVRDRNVRTATQTWEVDTVLLADTKQVYRACLDSVDELTDRFVQAYRSVNAAADHAPEK